MAKNKTAFTLNVPNETVVLAIAQRVAGELDIDADRVSVVRITRQKGGGVNADVAISGPLTKPSS